MSTLVRFWVLIAFLGFASHPAVAQQTNPVDRKVTNPMTDTPNVNPLTQDQPVKQPPPSRQGQAGEQTDLLKVDAGTQTVSGPKEARVFCLRRKRRRAHRHLSFAGRQGNCVRSDE